MAVGWLQGPHRGSFGWKPPSSFTLKTESGFSRHRSFVVGAELVSWRAMRRWDLATGCVCGHQGMGAELGVRMRIFQGCKKLLKAAL